MGESRSLVGGAVLGTAFNDLIDNLKNLVHKNLIFKELFKEMEYSLDAIRPLIQQIAECNNELVYCSEKELQGLNEVIREGTQLGQKCLKVSRWNPYKKFKYARKLLKWNESLKLQLDILKVQDTRDMKKMAVAVQTLGEKLDHVILYQYVSAVSSPSSSCPRPLELPDLPKLVVGLDVPLRELKQKFLRDDGASLLVLTAPGGCGKTTLATKFCHDQQVKDKFKENIIFVTVSQKGTLDHIVQQLCDHQPRSEVPTFQNDFQIGQWLQRYFVEKTQKPLLLVLDDVWSGSESLLGNFLFEEMSNYKILVTSRSEFSWFAPSYYLQLLDDHNAMKLFRHSASLEADGSSSYILEELSRKIVKRCNGFPLAITVVGRSLCNKPIEFWIKTEAEWATGSSILDSETKLFLCLQSSLDALVEDMAILKECFCDLGSFPEDYGVPLATLFDMWAVLYGLDDQTKCLENVYHLRTRTLANLRDHRDVKMEGDDIYDGCFVTQHDLLRELAIYHAKEDPVECRKRVIVEICGNDFPKWWREHNHQPVKARLLSISTGYHFNNYNTIKQFIFNNLYDFPKWWREHNHQPVKARLLSISTDRRFSMEWPNMQVPEAEVLILNFQTKFYALPEFVEQMNNLKVAVITKDDHQSADIINFDLLGSSSKLKSIILEGISIACITRKTLRLNSLKKISFYRCVIGLSFSNEVVKMCHAFPVLEEMNIQECRFLENLLPEICDLIQLKKLTITAHSDIEAFPEEIGNLVNLEVLRLRSCYDLLRLPGSVGNLKKLKLLDIFNCINMTELPPSIGELSSLTKLNMKWCNKMKELPLSVLYLDHLEEVICDDATKPLWIPFTLNLTKARIVAT